MPHKDPLAKKLYMQEYHKIHRERINKQKKEAIDNTPGKREEKNARARALYALNKGIISERRKKARHLKTSLKTYAKRRKALKEIHDGHLSESKYLKELKKVYDIVIKKEKQEAKENRVDPRIGKPVHSEEWKKKLSERWKGNTINLGKKHSQETKDKISNSNKGKPSHRIGAKNTPEHNKNIGLSKLGVKRAPFSKEWLENISKGKIGLFRGEKSSSWKGGVTDLRHLIRSSYKYKEWRTFCFERDNYTCQHCPTKGGKLQVDHFPKAFKDIFWENNIKSLEEAYACDEMWDTNNGRTLCIKCHAKTETWGRPYNKKEERDDT